MKPSRKHEFFSLFCRFWSATKFLVRQKSFVIFFDFLTFPDLHCRKPPFRLRLRPVSDLSRPRSADRLFLFHPFRFCYLVYRPSLTDPPLFYHCSPTHVKSVKVHHIPRYNNDRNKPERKPDHGKISRSEHTQTRTRKRRVRRGTVRNRPPLPLKTPLRRSESTHCRLDPFSTHVIIMIETKKGRKSK